MIDQATRAIAEAIQALIAQEVARQLAERDDAELWDAQQVRDYLGIADRTLGEWQKRSSFPRMVPGGKRRWKAADIKAYRASND